MNKQGKNGIGWTDYTWNPIAGCSPVSEGCQNCYAADIAKRFGHTWGAPVFMPERLDEPIHVKKPSRIFVCSMSDLFHERVANAEIDAIIYTMVSPMSGASHHTYLILTKRIERLVKEPHCLPERFAQWPNIWLGCTCENQERIDQRLPILMSVPAAVRFISVEPMLGPVTLPPKDQCPDWVICGPENGTKARPCDPDWIMALAADCELRGIPFFDKRPGAARKEFPQ